MGILFKCESLSIGFIQYKTGFEQIVLKPVKELNLSVNSGEMLAIVGASGSGKSLLAHAILGILPSNALTKGSLWFKDKKLSQADIESLRGRQIRFIPQSVEYLDPTRVVGKQIAETFDAKQVADYLSIDVNVGEKELILKLFERFSLPKKTYYAYPHELSGGMQRRVLFATCMGMGTELIVADEPTPGIHQEAIDEMMGQFMEFRQRGISIIFITHDMTLAMEYADKIAIFFDGRVINTYEPDLIRNLDISVDAYTKELWLSQPDNLFMEAL